MALYMNYNAGAVKGNVTAAGYENWIDISSMQFGVGRGISMNVGSMSNREVSLPSLSELTVTKSFDTASLLLLQDSIKGDTGVKVELAIVRTGSDKVEEVARITLEDTLISGYSMSSGGDRPSESLSLSYSKILFDGKGATKGNEAGQPVKVMYDLTTAKS